MNFADGSVCLMADVWNEGKLLSLSALRFTVSSAVHAWEFVCDLSAVDDSQLH
jgi:hypothetical protein